MGRHPNTPIALLMKKFSDVRIDHTEPEVFLKEFATNISSTKARLNEIQKKQAKLLNSRTLQDHHYEVDEYVFMENPTVNDIRTLPALQERFLGPFRVMEVVQPGVYRLNTDKSDDHRVNRRHPVFNAAKLKPAFGFSSLDIPLFDSAHRVQQEAEQEPIWKELDQVEKSETSTDRETAKQSCHFTDRGARIRARTLGYETPANFTKVGRSTV